jgi:hypothetical protein
MGVKVETPGMGVQYRRHADIRPQVFRVEAKVLQGAGSGGKQKRVERALMTPGKRAEFKGHGESHHEVFYRQQFGLLSIQPLTGFMVLTLRTAAMSAGTGMVKLRVTRAALPQYLTGIRCAATLYRPDGSELAG